MVTKVAFQLALDRAAGEGRERYAVVRIETIDSFDETEHGHLAQIVIGDTGTAEPLGDVGRQPHVAFD